MRLDGGAMTPARKDPLSSLTRWVLRHKRFVAGVWMAITVAAFAAVGPASDALTQEFPVPGREGFETNQQIAATYGNGGGSAPIVPVVTLPEGTTVDSPGVADELEAALAKVQTALPDARIASYGSTGDPAFVSADRRTTFALVGRPRQGGRRPRSTGSRSAARRSR
jgi:RND superfamily putative drug exporter